MSSSPREHQNQPTAIVAASMLTGVFLAFVYLLTYSGALHNTDERFFYDNISVDITGRLVRQGVLFSKILSPFLNLAAKLPHIGGFQLATTFNIIITSFTAICLIVLIHELTKNLKLSVFTGIAYGLSTLAWVYSHYLFREPLTAFLLLILLWLYHRLFISPRITTLIMATIVYILMVAIKLKTIALAPLLGLIDLWLLFKIIDGYGLWERFLPRLRNAVHKLASSLAQASFGKQLLFFLSLIVALHLMAIGAIGRLPAAPTFMRHGPKLSSFFAIWFSPGWGIFSYIPIFWIALVGIFPLTKKHGGLSLTITAITFFYFLLASEHPVWWGYWAFGPRQIVPFIPILMIPFAFGWQWLQERQRKIGIAIGVILLALSFTIQLIGTLAPFNRYILDVYFPASITGEQITWNISLWPVWGLLHYINPDTIDIAWLRSGNGMSYAIHWQVILPITLGMMLTGWLLMKVLTAQWQSGFILSVSLIIAFCWGALAIYSIHTVYADDRYQPESGYPVAAAKIRESAHYDDIILMDLWTEDLNGPSVALLNYCQGDCPPRLDIIRSDVNEGMKKIIQNTLDNYHRAWLVLTSVPEGDPNSNIEQWLGEVGYLESCEWTGPQLRLCLYSLPPGDLLTNREEIIHFGDHIQLVNAYVLRASSRNDDRIEPGDMLQIGLTWQTDMQPRQDLVLSTQLLGPDGKLMQAFDWRPGNGFHPSTSWQPGEIIIDQRALEIPEGAPTGNYTLLIILYDSATGQRLPVHLPAGETTDAFSLITFLVEPATP